MGIFSKIQNKRNDKKNNEILKGVKKTGKEEKFEPDFSLMELLDADWRFFGGRLMMKEILPANFSQKPDVVKVGLAINNSPYAEVTYKDRKTGDSRTYKLYQKTARFVNGSNWETKNDALEEAWGEFRRYLSAVVNIRKQSDIAYHQLAENAYNQFGNMKTEPLDFDDLYKREVEFLEKYQEVKFDTFGAYGDVALFACCEVDADGRVQDFHTVKPFSPRILEFCVARLTNEAKNKELENEEAFRTKCLEVALNSPFMSKDWERLPDVLFSVLKGQMEQTGKNKKHTDKHSILFASQKGE